MSTAIQPRQPAGIPTGGEYAARSRREGQVTLARHGMSDEQRKLRTDQLALAGYIQPIATVGAPPKASRREANDWWVAQFARAEHSRDGAGVHKMPEDYTPGLTAGSAPSGRRRTYRRTYTGEGISIRMPSATASRAYAAAVSPEAFDMPVQATINGKTVIGWVRVSRMARGQYAVSGLGMDPNVSAHISEAVSAVLEARKPTVALNQDLAKRRRERFAAGGTKIDPTSRRSAFINGVGYNKASGVMGVKIGKRAYAYKVSEDLFNMLRGSRSPGSVWNDYIVKKGYRSDEIVACDDCGRFTAATQTHRCPSRHLPPTRKPKRTNLEGLRRAMRVRL